MVVGLIGAIDELTKAFLNFGKDLEQRSLGLGLSFEQATARLGKGFDLLHGDMKDRMQVGLQSVAAGLQTTDGGLSQLINQQKLTGQQWQQTASIWASVVAAGVATEEGMKVLAEDTIALGDTYTVQTSLLTSVIKSLERNLVDMGLADMGPQVLGAITQLQATMGPMQKAHFEKVVQMVFDTSVEGYRKLALLNMPNIREQLSAASTIKEAANIWVENVTRGAQTIEDFTSDADQVFFRLGQAADMFGNSAKFLVPVAKSLNEEVRKSIEERTKFFEQWNVLIQDVWAPFSQFIAGILFPNLRNLGVAMTEVGRVFIEKFEDWKNSLGDTTIAVGTFKNAVIDVAQIFVDFYEFMKEGGLNKEFFGNLFNIIKFHFGDMIINIEQQWNILWTNAQLVFVDFKFKMLDFWDDITRSIEQKLELAFRNLDEKMSIKYIAPFTGESEEDMRYRHAGGLTASLTEGTKTPEHQSALRDIEEAGARAAQRLAIREALFPIEQAFLRIFGFEPTLAGAFSGWENIWSEMNQTLEDMRTGGEKTNEELAVMNNKIPDPNEGGGILAESAFILGDAIERVLGFDKGDEGINIWAEMLELQRSIEGKTGVNGVAAPAATPD